ncbi:MAG: hypothetical protein WEC17_02995 [Candidatus Saccharimonadales bacterium]
MNHERKIFAVDSDGNTEATEVPISPDSVGVKLHRGQRGIEYQYPNGSHYFVDASGQRVYDVVKDEWTDLPAGQSPQEYIDSLKPE